MAEDRLAQLASSSANLTEIVRQLRGGGLREVVGPDPLLHADTSDGTLDDFLSLAVREASDQVIFGLALSLPVCIIKRGVGQEALDYCLAARALRADQRDAIFLRLSMTGGPNEGLCDKHRRISGVARVAANTAAGPGVARAYYYFLEANIAGVLAQCPEELTAFLVDPEFGPQGYNLDCLVLAIKHSPDPEPFIRRWIEWIEEGRFDSAGRDHGRPGIMYACLQDYRGNPRFAAVRDAAHAHIVHLLQSPEKVLQAWRNLEGLLASRYTGADEVVETIRRSGLQISETQREILQYPLGALVALAQNRFDRNGKSFDEWMDLVVGNRPAGLLQ